MPVGAPGTMAGQVLGPRGAKVPKGVWEAKRQLSLLYRVLAGPLSRLCAP